MAGIFDELKDLGFNNLDNIELFKKKEDKKQSDGTGVKRYTVDEVLFDRSYTCPVCNTSFKSKSVRSGKNRLMTVDTDLKPKYDLVNPLLYEPVVCENCGYAALAKCFNMLSPTQITWIREKICTAYKKHEYPKIMTEKAAISKLKLVLLNAFVKKAKDGEKGYICLKLAWVYRELGDKVQEEIFLKNALTGFLNAYNGERFPIFELGELTTAYIIADIYRRFKDYDQAMKWVGYVVLDRSVTLRLKTRGLHLKALIKEEKEKDIKD